VSAQAALANATAAPAGAIAPACAPAAPTPALVLAGLTKRWQRRAAPVLDGLDLVLAPGTCTWVGGRNGAGKTTMLRVAAGLICAEAGTACAFGLDPRAQRVAYQRLVSFLPAGDRGLYARLTTRRQLAFWGRISLLQPDRFERVLSETLDAFALNELADRRVDRMSMGQRQRLRLAMTFLTAPRLVLLDEPLSSLDGEGGQLLAAAIAATLARDGAVLWCSPEPELEYVRFNQSWLLAEGRLVRA
jgi:ABC-type multidrug transport system ATPase subunit